MRLVYAPQALEDLLDTEEFIARNNPDNAIAFVGSLRERCESLAEQPGMGRRREDLAPGLYSFPLGNYLIFFRIKKGEEQLEIVRIREGSCDYANHWEE